MIGETLKLSNRPEVHPTIYKFPFLGNQALYFLFWEINMVIISNELIILDINDIDFSKKRNYNDYEYGGILKILANSSTAGFIIRALAVILA